MRKKMLSLFVITLCIISMLSGCTNKTQNVYEASNTDIRLTNLIFHEVTSDSTQSMVKDETEVFKDEIMQNYGIDIDECFSTPYNSKEIEKYTKLLTQFFLEVYGVDVSEEIQKVKTYTSTFPNQNILGFNVPGTYDVVLNQTLINYHSTSVCFTWCHEVIHALGLNYFSTGYEGLYETITEAVNFQFFEWNGQNFTNASLYEKTAKTIGYQLISADPYIVSQSLTDDSFFIEDRINSILADATYPLETVPETSNIAFQFTSFLQSIYFENANYNISPELFDFTAQEIAAAYCREFNLDEETLSYHKEHWLVKNFDQYRLLYNANGYLLKK